jgi:hypothetical protein
MGTKSLTLARSEVCLEVIDVVINPRNHDIGASPFVIEAKNFHWPAALSSR